jgi:hypothetical protein
MVQPLSFPQMLIRWYSLQGFLHANHHFNRHLFSENTNLHVQCQKSIGIWKTTLSEFITEKGLYTILKKYFNGDGKEQNRKIINRYK